ncbi:MAG: hypothetical protein ACREJ4_13825 [Candidatus Methylomirabilaceae bacterium]
MRVHRLCSVVLVGCVSSTLLVASSVASAANKDLVIIHTERWIDTLKGTIKNLSADRAEDIVIVVRFYGEPSTPPSTPQVRRSASRRELGQQTARLPALEPRQEAPFEVEIAEKYRKATFYKFEPRASWRKVRGDSPQGK